MKRSRALVMILALNLTLASCNDEEESEESSADETCSALRLIADDNEATDCTKDDLVAPVEQPDSGGGSVDPGGPVDAEACGSTAHGGTETRTRYQATQVVDGLGECTSEVQTGTCQDGVLTWTGSYTQTACTVVPATLEQGDIVLFREKSTPLGRDPYVGESGELIAFSSTGTFKGRAFNSIGMAPWYGYGLQLSYDNFAEKFYFEIGSVDASLQSLTLRFEGHIQYPFTLSNPTAIAGTSDYHNTYFQFGFGAERNTIRWIGDKSGSDYIIRKYQSGSESTGCEVDLGANRRVAAIFDRFNHHGLPGDVYIGFEDLSGGNVTGWGVGKFNRTSCAPTMTVLWTKVHASALVRDILYVQSTEAAGPTNWRDSIMVTVGGDLYTKLVYRWEDDGGWTDQGLPFENNAVAVIQDRNLELYTIEYSGSTRYLRKYSPVESGGTHLISTLFTETEESGPLSDETALGRWMTVMPDLN